MAVTGRASEGAEPRERRIEWAAFRSLWDRGDDGTGSSLRAGTTAVAVVLWVAALFVVFLTWNGAAERTQVAAQVPYLVSGGLTALLLTVAGAAVMLYGALLEAARDADGTEDVSRDGAGRPVPLHRAQGRRAG